MPVALNQLGQIAVPVEDLDAAEAFYAQSLGLRKLYRHGRLVLFDCAGVRLRLEQSNARPFAPSGSILCFRTPDIEVTMRALTERGVRFDGRAPDSTPAAHSEPGMVFFKDPAGNTLALMQ